MSEIQDLLHYLHEPSLHLVESNNGKWFAVVTFFPTLTSNISESISEEAYSFDGAVAIITQTLREYVKENYQ